MGTIPIETLLEAPDFAGAVNRLAREFRHKHGLPDVYQVGLLAPDVDAATRQLERRGVGPFVVGTGAPERWEERGEALQVEATMALAYHAGLEIELLEPAEGTAFYSAGSEGPSDIVVHHVGLAVDDVDRWTSHLETVGPSTWVRGSLKLGPLHVEFAYMDTVAEAGTILEFIGWRIRGRRVTPVPGTVTDVRRLQRWLTLFNAGRMP